MQIYLDLGVQSNKEPPKDIEVKDTASTLETKLREPDLSLIIVDV